MSCTLIHGDCLEEMDKLIDEGVKVDLVLTDVPYGTTACKWDNIIPFEDMWKCLDGITYETSPILLFGAEPFSSELRMSNLQNYKYDWIWNKGFSSNFLQAKFQPLNPYEIISVFYKQQPYYNPIKWHQKKEKIRNRTGGYVNGSIGLSKSMPKKDYIDDGTRYPLRIIEMSGITDETSKSKRVHPTQKPVKLLEYLIKTYTKENDTVLDFTMGSGSTGVACLQTNRNFIGIELDENYYNIAKERCSNYQSKLW